MKPFSLFAAAVATLFAGVLSLTAPPARAADAAAPAPGVVTALADWAAAVDDRLVDYYSDPTATGPLPPPDAATAGWGDPAKALVRAAVASAPGTGDVGTGSSPSTHAFPFAAGRLRARVQQAVVLEMAAAVRAGRVVDAQALRCGLTLPRGVSAAEGALVLQTLGGQTDPAKRADAARVLAREAITWQTTRVRVLLDEATRSAAAKDHPMPGRLLERLGEAVTLADLPDALRIEANVPPAPPAAGADLPAALAAVAASDWANVPAPLAELRKAVEERLPSLLTPDERSRRERLLLKIVQLVPQEYSAGVRDGQVAVPLEYREAVTFTAQARQMVGELAPLWLADPSAALAPAVRSLEEKLEAADGMIAAKATAGEVEAAFASAGDLLKGAFGITLRRSGTTADIVDEVMLETRSVLTASLSAAMAGRWADAERLRVEAYTTYDPELEARLMPRDPQLALDIERLLLDGLDDARPGVKELLDRRASDADLQAGYARVAESLDKAAAMLKSGISPTAAAMNAASIVLREGLEGLLVVVAIFAGLRGAENARRRRLIWLGIAASMAATAGTWVLSQTLMTSLRSHGEVIAAVTGILAIGVLLLITNWLFHQVYWRQWVTTLKTQATEDGGSLWQLVSVGFLVGYREGFETVLFLQSLVLDAGGQSVAVGVTAGSVVLLGLGLAALWVGLKLPYFKILMVTALMIGVVLITFVGGTVRAAQTVGWLPVHRLMPGSWPAWLGNWLGLYNTWESVIGQLLTAAVVLGTWAVARAQAKRKSAKRRQERAAGAPSQPQRPAIA
ncbi:MAG: iron permease [Phycisphaerales bacterium]|nr:iron permease [Phycisphaerales bacterium]